MICRTGTLVVSKACQLASKALSKRAGAVEGSCANVAANPRHCQEGTAKKALQSQAPEPDRPEPKPPRRRRAGVTRFYLAERGPQTNGSAHNLMHKANVQLQPGGGAPCANPGAAPRWRPRPRPIGSAR